MMRVVLSAILLATVSFVGNVEAGNEVTQKSVAGKKVEITTVTTTGERTGTVTKAATVDVGKNLHVYGSSHSKNVDTTQTPPQSSGRTKTTVSVGIGTRF